MEQNIFLEEYFKIILYLYKLKSALNILVVLPGLIRGNLMECWKKILKTQLSDSNFAPTFANHHLLPDIYYQT